MRAVVTGGAGFIGSAVVDALCAAGIQVLVVDDLSHGSLLNLENARRMGAQFAELDICDGPALTEELRLFAPDWVFHFAAQVNVRVSMVETTFDASVNILGSLNVFAAAAAAGARRVVKTSTGGAIYGETEVFPTPETVQAAPASAYGLSKLAAERYADWFRRARGLDIVTLRYGNVYGPRQDPSGDAGVIAAFCDAALHRRAPTIFGDGEQTRDFVFVSDIVAANLAAARAPRLAHHTYNVGTGREVSVTELAEAVAVAAGLTQEDFRPHYRPARAGELRRSCLDVRRVRHDLGVSASVELSVGLSHTLDWLREAGARRGASDVPAAAASVSQGAR
jgi:UDP-glucose 4-epimerase